MLMFEYLAIMNSVLTLLFGLTTVVADPDDFPTCEYNVTVLLFTPAICTEFTLKLKTFCILTYTIEWFFTAKAC